VPREGLYRAAAVIGLVEGALLAVVKNEASGKSLGFDRFLMVLACSVGVVGIAFLLPTGDVRGLVAATGAGAIMTIALIAPPLSLGLLVPGALTVGGCISDLEKARRRSLVGTLELLFFLAGGVSSAAYLFSAR
jgi:hypothetical protein